jgi:hypothetical protein
VTEDVTDEATDEATEEESAAAMQFEKLRTRTKQEEFLMSSQ